MKVFKIEAQGDTVYIQAATEPEALDKLTALMGPHVEELPGARIEWIDSVELLREQVEALTRDLTAARVEIAEFKSDDWTPTAAHLNALPDRIRSYIHQLETTCYALEADLATARAQISNQVLTITQFSADVVAARAETKKWLDAFNRSEQFQSGPRQRAEKAEAELAQVRSDWAQSIGKQQADEFAALRAERDQLQKDVQEHELCWDAFDAGQAAALKDEPRQSNPYPPGDSFCVPPEFSAWEDGYDCCINRRLKADLARLSVDADALTQAGARILELEADNAQLKAELAVACEAAALWRNDLAAAIVARKEKAVEYQTLFTENNTLRASLDTQAQARAQLIAAVTAYRKGRTRYFSAEETLTLRTAVMDAAWAYVAALAEQEP